MRTLWRAIVRTVLWSYERGTWPYDLMVGAIVVFVFLSPRAWFHDQAQVAAAPHSGQVQFQGENLLTGTRAYRVDFHLLVGSPRSTELERRAHDALRKNVQELKGKTFQIVRIEPVSGPDGTVLSYDIVVKQ